MLAELVVNNVTATNRLVSIHLCDHGPMPIHGHMHKSIWTFYGIYMCSLILREWFSVITLSLSKPVTFVLKAF